MKKLVSAIATMMMSLIVSLLACETIVRIWDGIPFWPPKDMVSHKSSFLNIILAAEYDPLLGWRQKPQMSVATWGLTTGELGIRMNSAEIKPLPPRGILAVGDSFTAGSEVVEDKTFSAQLEQRDYPVVNGGVGGYGTDQMILMAETLMPRLSPAAIVVGILDDDINRAGFRVYGGAPKPWFQVRDGRLVHHHNPVPAPTLDDAPRMLRWLAYSYLALWTTERLGWAHVWEQPPLHQRGQRPDCGLLCPDRAPQASNRRTRHPALCRHALLRPRARPHHGPHNREGAPARGQRVQPTHGRRNHRTSLTSWSLSPGTIRRPMAAYTLGWARTKTCTGT